LMAPPTWPSRPMRSCICYDPVAVWCPW